MNHIDKIIESGNIVKLYKERGDIVRIIQNSKDQLGNVLRSIKDPELQKKKYQK